MFKDIHTGKHAFVFGNAGTLKKRRLSDFQGRLAFGSNLIYKSSLPFTYYAVEDILVIEDRYEEIVTEIGVRAFYPENRRHFDNIKNFTPVRANWLKYDGELPAWLEGETFSLGFTVTYFLLQLAAYMGIRTVYLLGVMHHYSLPPHKAEGEVLISKGRDPDHFTDDYFSPGKMLHSPNLPRMEQAYRRAKLEYEKTGGAIYNCTLDTHLDVFPKLELEEALNDRLTSL